MCGYADVKVITHLHIRISAHPHIFPPFITISLTLPTCFPKFVIGKQNGVIIL
jgi:hypothetical protein